MMRIIPNIQIPPDKIVDIKTQLVAQQVLLPLRSLSSLGPTPVAPAIHFARRAAGPELHISPAGAGAAVAVHGMLKVKHGTRPGKHTLLLKMAIYSLFTS